MMLSLLGVVGTAGYQDLGGMQDVVAAQEGTPPTPGNDWTIGDGGQQDDGPIPPGNEW